MFAGVCKREFEPKQTHCCLLSLWLISLRKSGSAKMNGKRAGSGTTQLLEESSALPENREAVIQACYELVCSGRSLSEILREAKRLSAAATTATIVDKAGDICTAGAPCGGASQDEGIQTAEPSHSLGSLQPEVLSRMERCSRSPIGYFRVSLVAAACAIAAVGLSWISVWPLAVQGWGAQTVASETQRQLSPGFPAQAAVARTNVPMTSATPVEAALEIDAPLTSTAATSDFEESGRQYPLEQDRRFSGQTQHRVVALRSARPRLRADSNVTDRQRARTVLPTRGIAGFSPGPVWQYDRLIGRYVPLAGSGVPPARTTLPRYQ
jgi:hypothetical protein